MDLKEKNRKASARYRNKKERLKQEAFDNVRRLTGENQDLKVSSTDLKAYREFIFRPKLLDLKE